MSVLRTAALLEHQLNEALRPYGITELQYNVLRILRGAGPKGWCGREIAERFVRERLALLGKTLFLVSFGVYLFLLAGLDLAGGAPFAAAVSGPVALGHLYRPPSVRAGAAFPAAPGA